MWVKRIELVDFRNYAHAAVELDSGLNLFLGSNAQGKTNLLEAVYVASAGRSYRASRDADMIRWGQPLFRIVADVQRAPEAVKLEVGISSAGRRFARVDGTQRIRGPELADYLNVVMFTPDDLSLVKGSPSERRRFLDLEISQVSPAYRSWLDTYSKAMAQRNALLKQISAFGPNPGRGVSNRYMDLLDAWDEQLIQAGARIILRRAHVVADLSARARTAHHAIAGDRAELSLIYRPSVQMPVGGDNSAELLSVDRAAQAFRSRLCELRKAEIIRGVTLSGPHRDDVMFELDGVDMAGFGSQGQQRSTVLAVKLAEVEFVAEKTGQRPVLLLDDVLSELDGGRRIRLMDLVETGCQALITSVEPGCIGLMPQGAKVFNISSGEVSSCGASNSRRAEGVHVETGLHHSAERLPCDSYVERGNRPELEGEVTGDDDAGPNAVCDS